MPNVVQILSAALDKAVTIPSSAVHAHVEQIRRKNPGISPEDTILLLEREYLAVSATAGGAVGAAAAIPAVGTGVSIALTTANVGTYFAASAAFALAVADVHGIEVDDAERRRALLLTTILGEDGAKAVGELGLFSSGRWATQLLTRLPLGTVKAVNSTLTRRLVRTQATTQGALAFGRILPFGIGAVVGATGARALSKSVIGNARKAFGHAPLTFREVIEVIEAPSDSLPPLELPTGQRT
ncbi:MAG: hypothetical protein M3Y20_04170 [Actinomycetota bacterium]|nr:hypothetical protein [Actinomycetota bacterium]